jgi:hypothetical protein
VGWGQTTLTEGLNDWGRQAVLLLNYTLACPTTEERMENLTQGSRVIRHYLLSGLRCPSRDSIGWPAELLFMSVTPWEHHSALSQYKCFPSCRTKRIPAC